VGRKQHDEFADPAGDVVTVCSADGAVILNPAVG
jgi:hypothetical protein